MAPTKIDAKPIRVSGQWECSIAFSVLLIQQVLCQIPALFVHAKTNISCKTKHKTTKGCKPVSGPIIGWPLMTVHWHEVLLMRSHQSSCHHYN